jgi:uncharacterized peroxidase-related enzyme
VVHHGASLAVESGDEALPEAVASGRFEVLGPRGEVLCRYAMTLTVSPWAMTEEDLAPLRAVGLTDTDIVDANQVVSYFNYVNRVADGLGVELEDRWPDPVQKRRRYRLRERWTAGALQDPESHEDRRRP